MNKVHGNIDLTEKQLYNESRLKYEREYPYGKGIYFFGKWV